MKPKRLISLLLAVCMVIAMLPVSAFAADADDTFEYEYEGQKLKYKITSVTDKTVEVTKNRNVVGDLIIPEKVEDEDGVEYTVTGIGNQALPKKLNNVDYGNRISSVKIPSTVTVIGESAFTLEDTLTRVEIPASVTDIEKWAFYWCTNLTDIKIEENSKLTIIKSSAFSACKKLESFTIPQGVTTLWEKAFNHNDSLRELIIPDSVTFIGEKLIAPLSECPNVTVKYGGTKEQWEKINLAGDNTALNTKVEFPHNIRFEMNGHGTAPADQPVWSGDKLEKVADPWAAGYTFTGWYTDEALTQKFDVENDVISDDTTTLYAGWEPIPDHELTVKGGTFTFNDNAAADKGSVYEGAVVTVTLDENDPLWKDGGLSFDHWDIQSKATLLDKNGEEIVNPGKTFTFVMPEEGVTVEAVPKTAAAEDDSWDAATVVTGVVLGTGTAILAYHIGTELYAEQVLGEGVAVPKTREDVALKAWELAGKPAVELNGEPLSEAAQAEKWVVECGLMQNDAEGNFNGAKKMSKLKALRTLDAAKKLG